MSSSEALLRTGLLAAAFAATALLSACSGFTPVYSDQTSSATALHFADPNNPLEQIVYQDLGRRFGTTDNPDAPQVSVAVTTFARALTQSTTADPTTNYLMTATGVVRITRNGQPVLTATRQATATYTANSQVVADYTAQGAAGEQAAHALAETLELTIMSALTPAPAATQ
jgi:LPS-assembly lipoprotein